jgi:hypothetical protein
MRISPGISILEWRSSGNEFWRRSPASGPDNAFEHEDEHEGEDDDAVPKQKPARDISRAGSHCEDNLNQQLLERDASRFQALRLWQIHRENTLLDSGRNLVGID